MQIATLDIETTSLRAVGDGVVLMAGIKPMGGAVKMLVWNPMESRPGHEDKLLQSIFDEVEKYDLIVMHNGERFDWPYLKSRAMLLNMKRPKPPLVYDTMLGAKRCGFRTTLNVIGKPTVALDHLADFFGIPQEKTKIYPRVHWDIIWEANFPAGIEAMRQLVEHCAADVRMTEEVYWKIIRNDPKPKIAYLA